jgi:hypothetical protein
MFRMLTAVVAAAALFGGAAAAHAAPVAGAVTDGAGRVDSPEQDIRTAAATFDSATGDVRGAFALAQPPTSAAVGDLEVGVGTWLKTRGFCGVDIDVSLSPPDSEVPEWSGGVFLGRDQGPEATIAPQGASILFDVAWDRLIGKGYNCAVATTWSPQIDPHTRDLKAEDESAVFTLTAEEAQNPSAPPKCALRPGRLRRGKAERFTCSNVTGPLTIRIYRSNHLERTVHTHVGAGGRVSVSTRGLRRGFHGFYAWRGPDVLGYGDRKLR